MAQLRHDYHKFTAAGAEIVVVGPEGPAGFQAYWRREKLPFVGLPDPDHSVLKLYGQQVNLFKLGRMPAQVIVDAGGVARFVHYGHDMTDIPPNAELLELIEGLGEP
jgi:peroxiredoxin